MVELTAALVIAYKSRNVVPSADTPTVIKCIHAALLAAKTGTATEAAQVPRDSSEIAESITHDRLISFIDGKPYKTLKRHLTAHGMTPSEYRSRYGLPDDYPMVSPGYAAVRARIANQLYYGLEAA